MIGGEEGCVGDSSETVILATGGYDHTIKLWQAHTGNCQRTLQNPESQVNALEITPDRQRIAAAGYQHVRIYDINGSINTAAVNCEGLTKNVTSVGFQEDGKWMYTGGEDCSARIWDLRKGSMQCQRIFQVSAPVNCVCLHPNQAELIVGDQSGIIHIWDLKTDHNEQLIPETDAAILSMAVDPLGSFLAAVNNKGRCFIWELGGGTTEEPTRLIPKHKLEAHKRHALKCRFSPDSQMLVTTSADQTAKIWGTEKFENPQELTCDAQRWVWDAAFSLDSQYVVTASSDGVARLWDVAEGSIKREYTGHQKAITALALEDVARD